MGAARSRSSTHPPLLRISTQRMARTMTAPTPRVAAVSGGPRAVQAQGWYTNCAVDTSSWRARGQRSDFAFHGERGCLSSGRLRSTSCRQQDQGHARGQAMGF
eukprot:scaffold223239_cov26-Tisochrysis_lutea.AAC.2